MEYPLILGGCGFLGKKVVSTLIQQKTCQKIVVFDLKIEKGIFKSVEYIEGDICDEKRVKEVIHKYQPDVIFHMISPIHGLESNVYQRVNIEGTKYVIRSAIAENVKAIIYTSSAGVVFNGKDLIHVNETIPIPKGTMDAYNETKVSFHPFTEATKQRTTLE
ncbi:hypothetical protein PCK1_000255 [Pneumocystis canis]|nr:hypothetical protein PCK1_000255 [Pneumocystis canis]